MMLQFTLWCVDKSVSSTLEGRGTSAAAAKSCTRDALGDGPGGGRGDGVTLRGFGPGLRRAVTNISINLETIYINLIYTQREIRKGPLDLNIKQIFFNAVFAQINLESR